MNISRELWQQINPLLTDAFELDGQAREAWLQGLDQTHPLLTPMLRKMLAAHDRAERSRELETVPRLAPPPPRSSAFAVDARIGPFALMRPLGRGGMGEVWLARQADGRVEREVALKLPTIYLHSEVWRERFRRERDILARLAHPNIARLFDAGVSDEEGSRGQPYLAMEYIEGESLTDFVTQQKASITERLKLFRQILAAVAHAHRHLVVHRDLKPANILIDQSGQVKLLDFGIAKLIDDGTAANAAADLTQLGGRVMTLRYAAPEQVSDSLISTATDTYALGVILHELLTGLSPYRAVREAKPFTEAALLGQQAAVPSSLMMASAAAADRNLPSAKSLSRQIAGDLDAIILKALRPNPAARYASVEQFDDDLQRHLESRPVKAREGTWRYLAGRFATRYKLPIAATAAVLLTLVIGVVMVEQQRRLAVAEKARAEKHFASVRKLANSFMFEVQEEIVGLSGALKAREMLLKTSLSYLDNLAGESGNDPALMAELAAAYAKIGDIQGQAGGANLGMRTESFVNYEKARKLFIDLGARKADDIAVQREHIMLRYSLSRAYAQNSDPRWQENIAAAVQLAERAAALKDAMPRDRVRAATMASEQAHLTSVLTGQTPAAESQIEQAITDLEKLQRDFPGQAPFREHLGHAYRRGGDIFSGSRHTPESMTKAVELLRKSLDIFSALSREYPNQQRYAMFAASSQGVLADALEMMGRHSEADEAIMLALQRNRALSQADPKNIQQRTTIITNLASAARIAYRRSDLVTARQRGRDAIALYLLLPADQRTVRESRDILADAQAYLGLALLASADQSGKPMPRSRTWPEACKLLAESVAFVEEMRASHATAIDEDAAKERSDGLARCKAQPD